MRIDETFDFKALDKCMHLFWQRGYFNTPIDALVKASGLNRAAIYQHFGGKEGLFIAMLERYWAQRSRHAFELLRQPEASLAATREFFHSFIQKSVDGMLQHGCFYIATAAELPSHKQRVQVLVHQFIEQLAELLRLALRRAQAKQEIAASCDIEACADFLLANVFGLLSLARAEHKEGRVRAQVRILDDYLSKL